MKPRVFYHDVTVAYPAGELDKLPGVPSYTARALAMSQGERGDAVIIPPSTLKHLPWILEHYKRVGLNVARIISAGDMSTLGLGQFKTHDMSVFIFTEHAHAIRPNERRLEAVRLHNNKNRFMELCGESGVPTPRTVCYSQRLPLESLPLALPCYVKAAESASGQGVTKCHSLAEVNAAIAELRQPMFQVQEGLPEGTLFLNVQYRNEGGCAVRGPITLQILDGNSHDGNIHPAGVDEERVWQVTDGLAQYGAERGLEEIWAYDVAWTPDGRVLPIECNPRANGCTYFSEVARKLDVVAWEARNVKFAPGSFDQCELGDLEYEGGKGIIIVNWGCVSEHKLGLFIAGSPEDREWYRAEFNRRFNDEAKLRSVA